jgi:hypothetical protein
MCLEMDHGGISQYLYCYRMACIIDQTLTNVTYEYPYSYLQCKSGGGDIKPP